MLLTVLGGCNQKIDLDQLFYSTVTLKVADTSYFVLNLQLKETITLEAVELPTYHNLEMEVIEFTTNQTPEGWEKSRKLSFPAKVNEDTPVTVVFISRDPAIDVTVNKEVSLTINGESYVITSEDNSFFTSKKWIQLNPFFILILFLHL